MKSSSLTTPQRLRSEGTEVKRPWLGLERRTKHAFLHDDHGRRSLSTGDRVTTSKKQPSTRATIEVPLFGYIVSY